MGNFRFRRCREPKLLTTYSIRKIFVQCMMCPIVALLLCFTLGSIVHPETLYNYRWACGTVHLPSVSRVINLPLERTIFQLLILFSVPYRIIILFKHWLEFSRKEASRRYAMTRKILAISGLGDLIFLCLLSVIGERESGDIHVLLFTMFTIFSYAYFVAMTLLTRWTYPSKEQESLRKSLQMFFLCSVTVTIPIICIFFILYNVYCIPATYEFFAIFEYLTVASIYGFHISSFWRMTGCIHVYHSNIKVHAIRV